MRESAIADRAKELFEKRGWIFTNYPGGKYGKKGWPDAFVLKEGFNCWLEFKQPGKKPTKIQRYWIHEINVNGGSALWGDSAQGLYEQAEAFRREYHSDIAQGLYEQAEAFRREYHSDN